MCHVIGWTLYWKWKPEWQYGFLMVVGVLLVDLVIVRLAGSWGSLRLASVQFSHSVLSDGDSVDCSMPGLPVHHQLLEFTPTHVHWLGDAIQPSHPLSSLLLPPSIFPSIRVFSSESVLHISGSQSTGVSASAWVLSMNIQDWFPLGWTDWISLLSKGLSRVQLKPQDNVLFPIAGHIEIGWIPSLAFPLFF